MSSDIEDSWKRVVKPDKPAPILYAPYLHNPRLQPHANLSCSKLPRLCRPCKPWTRKKRHRSMSLTRTWSLSGEKHVVSCPATRFKSSALYENKIPSSCKSVRSEMSQTVGSNRFFFVSLRVINKS
ncbi:unnamed protein product [Periconia digitata]|uniref:Uncharacterized protein n=1 Tax=Periconia digitata TaxID=1303443 RepID=A0A9W4UJI3_9PLEO|nr:unnamed protein product [Periconia digitata]